MPKDTEQLHKKQQGDPNLSGGEVEDAGGVVGETPNTDTLSGDKEDEQHDRNDAPAR